MNNISETQGWTISTYPEANLSEQPVNPAPVRDVTISSLNRGYVVKVGCHSFAFETVDGFLLKLGEYLKDPIGTEDKWFKGELFK